MLTFKSLKFKFAALNLHIQEYVEFANSLEGTLVLRKPLDFESERQLNVSIRAQDQGNPPLYNETYVIIRVQDADDQNPLFSRPRYVAYLPQPAVKVIHLCKFLDLNTGNCFNCSHWSTSSTWFFFPFFLKIVSGAISFNLNMKVPPCVGHCSRYNGKMGEMRHFLQKKLPLLLGFFPTNLLNNSILLYTNR